MLFESSALFAALFAASAFAAPVTVEAISGNWPSTAFSPTACIKGHGDLDGSAFIKSNSSGVKCLYKNGNGPNNVCVYDLTSGAPISGGSNCPFPGQSLVKTSYAHQCFSTCPTSAAGLGNLVGQSIETMPGTDKTFTFCSYEQSMCYYQAYDGMATSFNGPPDSRCPPITKGTCTSA